MGQKAPLISCLNRYKRLIELLNRPDVTQLDAINTEAGEPLISKSS
ncbi:hypothetical protein E4N72_03965 [Treponema vincentii]|nr:hypothetical protein E4N72_03965 [Treponema vincentii]